MSFLARDTVTLSADMWPPRLGQDANQIEFHIACSKHCPLISRDKTPVMISRLCDLNPTCSYNFWQRIFTYMKFWAMVTQSKAGSKHILAFSSPNWNHQCALCKTGANMRMWLASLFYGPWESVNLFFSCTVRAGRVVLVERLTLDHLAVLELPPWISRACGRGLCSPAGAMSSPKWAWTRLVLYSVFFFLVRSHSFFTVLVILSIMYYCNVC